MRWMRLLAWGSLGCFVVVACGSSDRSTGPATTVVPDGGAVAEHDASVTVPTDSGQIIGNTGSDAGDGGDGALPEQCAADTQAAQKMPLDLYFMVDISGSMTDTTAAGTTKWQDLTTSLKSFIDDPSSAGIGVGMQFFPSKSCEQDTDCPGASGGCGYQKACQSAVPNLVYCNSDSDCTGGAGDCTPLGVCLLSPSLCLGSCGILDACIAGVSGHCRNEYCASTYYAVADAPIAALPGNAGTLKARIDAQVVGGQTPTAPALQGAIAAAAAQKAAHPDHATAVVLVTDGFPTECTPVDIPGVAAIAGQGAAQGVKSFVIGVFADAEAQAATSNLNQVASAGGSNQAFVVNTQQNVNQGLLQALSAIRGAALPCDFALPIPKSGTPDYNKVNVQYSSGSGSPSTIPYVGAASGCDPAAGGWYYDVDPKAGTPTKVEMCPKTCTTIQGDDAAKIDIVQGCTTVSVVK